MTQKWVWMSLTLGLKVKSQGPPPDTASRCRRDPGRVLAGEGKGGVERSGNRRGKGEVEDRGSWE